MLPVLVSIAATVLLLVLGTDRVVWSAKRFLAPIRATFFPPPSLTAEPRADTPEEVADIVWGPMADRTADNNPDPTFRATTLSILDMGLPFGSASLVRHQGAYHLVTVKHVADRVVAGQRSLPDRKASRRFTFHVPGLGLYPLLVKPADLAYGDPRATQADRLTLIPIDPTVAQRLQEAEASRLLAVPSFAKLDARFGDPLWKPTGSLGDRVPFVYLGGAQDGAPRLVPLMLLDGARDHAQGVAWLVQRMNERLAMSPGRGQRADVAMLDDDARSALASEIVVRRAAELAAAPGEQAQSFLPWLACDGDSGSPFLDGAGRIVGVLQGGGDFMRAPISGDGLSANRGCSAETIFAMPAYG